MAKDGTRRGGRRVRAGDKPKALSDKIAEGKDADIMEFHAPELDAADLDDAADSVKLNLSICLLIHLFCIFFHNVRVVRAHRF